MSTPPSGGGGVGVGGVKNENFLKNAQNGLKHLENEFGVILSTFFFSTKMAATEYLAAILENVQWIFTPEGLRNAMVWVLKP